MPRRNSTPVTPADPPTATPAATPTETRATRSNTPWLESLAASEEERQPRAPEPPATADERPPRRRASDKEGATDPPLDPVEAAARTAARQKLLAVKQKIQQKTDEMLTAEPAAIPILTQELQRLRVASLTLREIAEDVADPNTYREIGLLNKMMTGYDPEEDAKRREQDEGEAEARGRLAGIGVTPERAGSLLRTFAALQTAMEQPLPVAKDEDDDPESDRPAAVA